MTKLSRNWKSGSNESRLLQWHIYSPRYEGVPSRVIIEKSKEIGFEIPYPY